MFRWKIYNWQDLSDRSPWNSRLRYKWMGKLRNMYPHIYTIYLWGHCLPSDKIIKTPKRRNYLVSFLFFSIRHIVAYFYKLNNEKRIFYIRVPIELNDRDFSNCGKFNGYDGWLWLKFSVEIIKRNEYMFYIFILQIMCCKRPDKWWSDYSGSNIWKWPKCLWRFGKFNHSHLQCKPLNIQFAVFPKLWRE